MQDKDNNKQQQASAVSGQVAANLAASAEVAHAAIFNAIDAVIVIDRLGIIHLFNPAAEQLFGYKAEEVLGKSINILMPEEQAAQHDAHLQRYCESGRSLVVGTRREVPGRRKDGKIFPAELSMTEVHLGDKRFFTGILHDITDLKRTQGELLEARYRAEAAAQAKGEFLANMSHEIRTPLTSILGFTEALLQQQLSAQEQERILKIVARNGHYLLQVINNILDLSKIEAGKIETEKVECSLFSLLSSLEALVSLRARESDLYFQIDYKLPLPAMILTDPVRLMQALVNLTGNAIKFTYFGGIRVTVSYNQTSGKLYFDVIDTGIGLTEEQQSRLFTAFTQAAQSTTRIYGGSGLGLVISRHLAEKLGGTVTVQSSFGAGSTFSLSIDPGELASGSLVNEVLQVEGNESEAPFEIPELRGNVLLAEDGVDNQELFAFLLKKSGLSVTIAQNGKEAVAKAVSGNFDLILLDMQMPIMDGYSAAALLREEGYRKPIIALTANVLRHDLNRCLQAGCVDYISKPFRQKDFFSILTRYLEDAPSSQEPAEGSSLPNDQIEKISQNFLKGLPARLAECRQVLAQEDWPALRNLAHKLRGAELFGFSSITRAAASLERHCNRLELEKIRSGFSELEDVCQSVLERAPLSPDGQSAV